MLHKPAYKLTFAAPPSGGGIAGAVAGALGGGASGVVDTTADPQASTLVSLTVTLDMGIPADSFTLVMGQVGGATPEFGGEVTIELGDANDGSLTQVVKGIVTDMTPGMDTRRVVGHSAALSLLRTYADETIEGKNAGQIVKDLAGRAGVDIASADNGISFPAYVIDGRRNVYRHMHEIAGLCGFDLYIDAENKLVFKEFKEGNTKHTFKYGQHILDLDVQYVKPSSGQVAALGESPGGSQSRQDWAWLTKDFSGLSGTAGSEDPITLLERATLRTGASAKTAADALQARNERRTLRGTVLVAGYPQAKLGDSVELTGLLDESLNQTYQIRAVKHRISKQRGFMTTISFQQMPS